MFNPNSMEDLDKIVLENKNKLLLLYFGAVWCGPCKALKKNLKDENLMSNYNKMVSIYIDVDNEKFSDLSQTYKISSLPTQIITILKDNQLLNIHKIEGYDWNKLISLYEDSIKYLNNKSEESSDDEENQNESSNDSDNDSNDDTDDTNDTD